MTTTLNPYARVTFRGKLLDLATATALREAEARLGYELTIVQGIGGATASAGTHTNGRAVDLADWDHVRKVRVLRDLGFAAWYRPELPGVWGPHIHAVCIFENRSNTKGIAWAAFAQIAKYDRGEDGLADPPTRDPNPYRPSPAAVYTLREFREDTAPVVNDVTKMRDKLVEARHALGDAIALGRSANENRTAVKKSLPGLRKQHARLTMALVRLPRK